MDIEKANTQLDKADTFLTKLKNILKKHQGILVLLLLGYFVYWALTTETPEEPAPVIAPEQVLPLEGEEYDLIKKEFFIDDYGYRAGDTVYVDYYSDGYIEEYYSDGEGFIDQ